MHKVLLLLKISLVLSLMLVISEAHRRHNGRPSRRPSGHPPSPHSRHHSPPHSRPWSTHFHPFTTERPTHKGSKHPGHGMKPSKHSKGKGKKLGKRDRFFIGKVRMQMKWMKNYNKLDSPDTKKFIKRFREPFKRLFPGVFKDVRVQRLSPGSVIVEFTLTITNGTVNDVRTKLGEGMTTGKFGDMNVDKNSLKVDESESSEYHEHKHEKHHSKNHLSLEAKAAIIVLAIVLSCVFIAVGVWFYMKGKKSKKQNKVQEEFDNPIKFPHDSVA